MKYPLNWFVLEHSEDYKNGKTLVMNIGPASNKQTMSHWDLDIIMWEVREDELFIIVESKEGRTPYKGYLKEEEKRWAFQSLFEHGIRDDR